MPTNAYQEARAKKAARIADYLQSIGVTSAQLRYISTNGTGPHDEWWEAAATIAGSKVPSEATRAMVIEMLEGREKVRKQVESMTEEQVFGRFAR